MYSILDAVCIDDFLASYSGHEFGSRIAGRETRAFVVRSVISTSDSRSTSHECGARVDNVRELEVVTGKGDMFACSAENDSGLFHAVRGGAGQYGVIARARIALRSRSRPRGSPCLAGIRQEYTPSSGDHSRSTSNSRRPLTGDCPVKRHRLWLRASRMP